jgi:hypothetical protein
VVQAPEDFGLCMPKGDRTDAPSGSARRCAPPTVAWPASSRGARGKPLPARPPTSTGDEPWRL